MNSTIYIRPEDMDKWLLISNKSLFVHQALNDSIETKSPKILKPEIKPETKLETFNKLKETIGVKLCKVHGLPLDGRGRCLQKGCKYS